MPVFIRPGQNCIVRNDDILNLDNGKVQDIIIGSTNIGATNFAYQGECHEVLETVFYYIIDFIAWRDI